MKNAKFRTLTITGAAAKGNQSWTPTLHVQELSLAKADRCRPVLYVHGATFSSANSIFFKFDGISWGDALNRAGYSVWGFDFAGYGESERYLDMSKPEPSAAEPLGRAPEVALQIERVMRAIIADTGAPSVSIIAHSWGTIPTGLFATQHPELVDRLVFFGPIACRKMIETVPRLDAWRLLTIEEQHQRFVEDVPVGHPPVFMEQNFPDWAALYLKSDSTSGLRTPPSVKTPNGPLADIMMAWSGALAYDPSMIKSPVAIIRGEWDSLCKDGDVEGLLSAMISAPEKQDVKIAKGTHLMHLEQSRYELYQATNAFLNKQGD